MTDINSLAWKSITVNVNESTFSKSVRSDPDMHQHRPQNQIIMV